MCRNTRAETRAATEATATRAATEAHDATTANASFSSHFLDETLANALCTAVVVGYAIDATDSRFEYTDDESVHEDIRKTLGALGVTIQIGKSERKSTFPMIAAKCNAAPTAKQAGVVMDYETKASAYMEARLERLRKEGDLPPIRGAYLGGYSTPSRIHLVGVSSLDLYEAKYRKVDGGAVRGAYEQGSKVTRFVDEWLLELTQERTGGLKISGLPVDAPDIPPAPRYREGHLFKSYHGMTKALDRFWRDVDAAKNGIFFEIALGPDTNKVSSCFPCCTFMTSAGHPPTSTHLGRGDNWNIPSQCGLRGRWEENVEKWFRKGRGAMQKSKVMQRSKEKKEILAALQRLNARIPEVFLEALTFEEKFTNRILNTLEERSA